MVQIGFCNEKFFPQFPVTVHFRKKKGDTSDLKHPVHVYYTINEKLVNAIVIDRHFWEISHIESSSVRFKNIRLS